MERLPSVDICRGIAILCMLVSDIPLTAHVDIAKTIGNVLAVPLFLFIAGVSFELFVLSRKEKHTNILSFNIETFWKAIILYGITQIIFLVGVLAFPQEFSLGFNSTVFFVIAAGYILSIIIPGKWMYLIPAIFIPFIISYFSTSLPGVVMFIFSPPFPLIPYIAYFFAGRGIMIVYETRNDQAMKSWEIAFFSLIMVAILEILFILLNLPSILLLTTRTHILGFLLLAAGIISILSLFSIGNDRIKGFNTFFSPLERIGRIAFSTYYVFYGMELVVFPFLNRRFVSGLDPKLQIIAYFLSIVIIVMIMAGIEKIWRKADYKFGMEWAMRRGSAYMTKNTVKVLSYFPFCKN